MIKVIRARRSMSPQQIEESIDPQGIIRAVVNGLTVDIRLEALKDRTDPPLHDMQLQIREVGGMIHFTMYCEIKEERSK